MAEGPSWLLHDPGFPQTQGQASTHTPGVLLQKPAGLATQEVGTAAGSHPLGWSWLMGASLFLSAT